MVSKYGHLIPPMAFSDKVIPYIDFTDQVVHICVPRQIVAWYYMKFLHLWRADELFKTNFEFK